MFGKLKEKLKELVAYKSFEMTRRGWEARVKLGRWEGLNVDLTAWSRTGAWDLGVVLDVGDGWGDEDVALRVGLGFVQTCVSVEWPKVLRDLAGKLCSLGRSRPNSRQTGLRLGYDPDHGLTLRASVFNTDDWSRDASFLAQGWSKYIELADVIFGKAEYQEAEKKKKKVTLKLPEGEYEAKVTTWACRWVRPRLPTPRWSYRANVDVKVGIENHHDKGPLWGTCFAVSEHRLRAKEAANKFIGDVLKERLKYGGTWMAEHRQPKPTEPAEDLNQAAVQ